MGKIGDFSLCKKVEVNSLVNAKLFSNHKISRKLKVCEDSVRLIKKKIEFATTKVIKSQLQDINVNASERTVRRKLKDLNFKTCRPTRKSKLTPATEAKRLNWAKHWCDKDVYLWRSSKTQFVYRRDGEKFHSECVVRTVKHPTKIMIWSVISVKGTGRLDVVKAFLAEQNIPLLDWPGNSPDMNPIENIWELMKREVAKDVITNKTQLLERIIHVWNNHPQMQETVQSCIDSMPRRFEALIAAKGGSTKY
ncbi:transposable element Tcb2 transposase [Trichonephila clavipes]|uniref:Transposable element Tcb2 transposase n=1 Tax=Trichonephila clavipes TaxID=2585209 RepID=A0A8X6RBZ3_TRICX|nr:transposable element Tcb2 transposase [Trichonephila clavipes]